MDNQNEQNPPPRKSSSGTWISIALIAVMILVLALNLNGCSAGTPRGTFTTFTNDIGYLGVDDNGIVQFAFATELDESDPPVEIETNRIPSNVIEAIVQQGNEFYVLRAGSYTDPNTPSKFTSNPSGYATYYFYYNAYYNVADILQAYNVFVGNKATQLKAAATTEEELDFANRYASAFSVSIDSKPVSSTPLSTFVNIILPILTLLFIGVLIFFVVRSFSSRSGLGNMSKNRATHTMGGAVRFSDVAGIDEEKEEVQEIVQFLKNSQKFLELGARIPKGVLMVGQPGTGKTLLAKAIAGEAGVHFFSISGSDFSEMLVGVGPSRMRDLFETAKLNSPAIIFIDEIDSIARMRGVGVSGVSDENEQTLNQLLVQMDGFTKSEGVIVIAATNRPDVLDQALLRPGRFDRQIIVQMPDVKGREQILKVHAKQKPLSSDVDLKRVAQIISGFTGADIENLLNEAAIIAAKKDKKKINMSDITEGINKVLLGPQKRSRIITEDDKKITAYHEAGHAIVSRVLQPKHVVQEVSIIPRGMAAGYTLTNDKDDVTAHKSRNYLNTQLAVYMAGRVSEQIFIGDICTGSSNDLKVATGLAERMVTMFGMSDKLGPLYYGKEDEMALRLYNAQNPHSESLQAVIDSEVKAIILASEKSANDILKAQKAKVDVMAQILLERETIYAEDIDLIMKGKDAKTIVAEMEKRDVKSRELEQKDKIDAELALLEHDLARIMEWSHAYIEAGQATPDKIDALKANMELARQTIREGRPLKHLPNLDNLDSYAKMIEADAPQSDVESQPDDKKKKQEAKPTVAKAPSKKKTTETEN